MVRRYAHISVKHPEPYAVSFESETIFRRGADRLEDARLDGPGRGGGPTCKPSPDGASLNVTPHLREVFARAISGTVAFRPEHQFAQAALAPGCESDAFVAAQQLK
jgi:hypothetical protein